MANIVPPHTLLSKPVLLCAFAVAFDSLLDPEFKYIEKQVFNFMIKVSLLFIQTLPEETGGIYFVPPLEGCLTVKKK